MNADVSMAAVAASPIVFEVLADLSPGLLPRLLQPLARRNLVPRHLEARQAGAGMRICIGLDDIPSPTLALIEGNLRQIVGVAELCCRSA
ncbi:MAG: hypothetical protein ACREFV_05965 [Acetobacteraceae bacterium]